MDAKVLRILIVEDTPERQEILRSLVKKHAWILVHTAARAICLLDAYDFDLIFLDFDLAGEARGDSIAEFIPQSRNREAKVIVHSMNQQGANQISARLPNAEFVPLSRMMKNNVTFKRLRQELLRGSDINWAFVFGGKKSAVVKK